METSPTTSKASSVLLSHTAQKGEYYYSCDVSFRSAVSEKSFFDMRFGITEGSEYRLSLSLDSTVELCHVTSGETYDKYSILFTDTLFSYKGSGIKADKFDSAQLSTNETFKLAVAVKNSYAYIYADGIMIGEAPLPADSTGGFGLGGRGVEVITDNVSVSYTLPVIKGLSNSYECNVGGSYGNLSSPFTVFSSDSASVTSEYVSESRAPCVLFGVKALDGVLYVYSNGSQLGTLEQRLPLYRDSAVLAFRVSDEESAETLCKFLDEEAIHDAFIISSSEGYIRTCLGTGKYRRGVLDVSARTSLNTDEIAQTLYKNNMRTVILSERAADFETVYSLRAKMITVLINSEDSESSLYNAVACGADGVLTDRGDEMYRLMSSFEEGTVNKQSVAFIKCDGKDSALSAATSGAGAVYGKRSLRGGEWYIGSSLLSEVYSSVSRYGTAIYCMYGESGRDAVLALQKFCIDNSASTDIFLLCDLQTAQYTSALDGLYAHVISELSADGDKNASRLLFDIESTLRSVNSVFITESPADSEFIRLAAARGIGIYTFENGNSEPISPYAGFFTDDADVLDGKIKYAYCKPDGNGVTVECVPYSKNSATAAGTASLSYSDGTVSYEGSAVTGAGNLAMQIEADGIYLTKTVYIGSDGGASATGGDVSDSQNTDGSQNNVTAIAIAVSATAVIAGLGTVALLRRKKS